MDIGRIAELRGVRPQADGGLEIGALTTYVELLDDATSRTAIEADLDIGDDQAKSWRTIRADRPR